MTHSATAAHAGYRDGSFIRIWRIVLITRIDPNGVTAPLFRAGIFCSRPLGMHQSRIGAVMGNNKEQNPSNPANPLHPDETSVSVARRNGESS
jgi:hypothetical protein